MSLVRRPNLRGDWIREHELQEHVLENTLVEVLRVHSLEEGPYYGTDSIHENSWHVDGEH